MLYYGARELENCADRDDGAQIRDVIKSAARWGACDESLWPYDPAKVLIEPTPGVYTAALKDCAIGYHRIAQNLDLLRGALADENPIVAGIVAYSSFESGEATETGDIPMPILTDYPVGGHAILLCGYDDAKQQILFRNSWGSTWGKEGYGTLPYAYVLRPEFAIDFWTINLVTP